DGRGVVGYLLGRRYPDVWHLLDVAVMDDQRRRGIGTRLVRSFVAAAEASAKGVLLEVRRTNAPAVALYESQGFVTIGIRRRYYTDSGEDALVMARELGTGRDVTPRGKTITRLLAVESSCDDSAAAVLTA